MLYSYKIDKGARRNSYIVWRWWPFPGGDWEWQSSHRYKWQARREVKRRMRADVAVEAWENKQTTVEIYTP